MGGSSKKPKQQVTEYNLSMHMGVCHSADAVLQVNVNEKEAWKGDQRENLAIPINRPGLFGGVKQEGGLRGLMHVLLGGPTQVLDNSLASRLGGAGTTGSQVPGFRGVTSLFFTGGGPQSDAGFYWTANTGYLRPVDVKVRRAPGTWYPAKAMLPSVETPPEINGGVLAEAIVDARYLSPGLNPSNTSDPDWDDNFSKTLGIGQFFYSGGNERKTYYTPPGGESAYYPPAPYPANPGYYYVWDLPEITYTLPFDYRWVLKLSFDGADGLRWDVWGSFDSVGNFPPNSPGASVQFIGTSGEVLLSVTIQTHTNPVGASPARVVRASWSCPRTGQSWVSPTATLTQKWTVDFYFGANEVGVSASPVTVGSPNSASFAISPKEIVAVRYKGYPGKRYNADSGSQYFGGVLEVRGLSSVSNPQDANPAHIIYDCLTNDDWGLGLPDAMIDLAAFTNAADILYSEGFGLSMAWSQQSTIESFINDVLSHIDGTYGIDPETGRIFIKLIRGGYSTGSLFHVNQDNSRITRFQRKALGETVNEVVVTWTNPENEQEETVVVHDLANYAQQGALISSSSNYYGVRSATLALRLAMRDLTRSAYPVASVDFEVNRTGWGFKPGDVVKVTSAEYGFNELAVRITSVDYGRPGEMRVKVSAVEDVFALSSSAYVSSPPSEWTPPGSYWPSAFSRATAGSMPFYVAAQALGSSGALDVPVDQAYSWFIAGPDNADTDEFDLYAEATDALGTTSYTFDSTILVCGRAVLSAPLVPEILSTGVSLTGRYGNEPAGAQLVVIGGLSSTGELALVTNTSPLTLQRGVLDTSPGSWPAGTTVWFVSPDADLSAGSAYLAGSAANFKLLPTTSQGTLDLAGAPVTTVSFVARQHMPYRPANVTINGVRWPTLIEGTSGLTVNYSRRNRVTEDPVIVAWDAADTAPEAGTTYSVKLYRTDTGALLTSSTGITGTSVSLTSSYTGNVRLEVSAQRDGLNSFQPFSHVFNHIPGGIRITEGGDTRITEDGQVRALEA